MREASFKDYKKKKNDAEDPLIINFRLRCIIRYEDERREFISWLITGKMPEHDNPPQQSFEYISKNLKRRRRLMVERLIHHGCDGKSLVTTNELYSICLQSQFRCAITGSRVAFKAKGPRVPYWSLSIDHRVPLNYSKYDPEAWSKDNLQVMSSVMNTIKSDLSDREIYRWYRAFYKAHIIEL